MATIGWVEYAPFQKIVVTAGIDHIPPPLLRQLAPNGIMVIPVGPPSGQTVLRIVKRPAPGGGLHLRAQRPLSRAQSGFRALHLAGRSSHSLDDTGAEAEQ